VSDPFSLGVSCDTHTQTIVYDDAFGIQTSITDFNGKPPIRFWA
jgi:hypothetical protein